LPEKDVETLVDQRLLVVSYVVDAVVAEGSRVRSPSGTARLYAAPPAVNWT
jgi:hypothetical protein